MNNKISEKSKKYLHDLLNNYSKIGRNENNGIDRVALTQADKQGRDYFIKLLKENNFKTHIETSGSNKLTGEWDWICLSPKKNKLPLAPIYKEAHELKVIVFNKHDLEFAQEQAAQVGPNCHLYLQPEWSVKDKVVPMIVDFVMANPAWKVSLQTHKYLNIP